MQYLGHRAIILIGDFTGKIEEMKKAIQDGRNPKDIKYILAKIITGLYHTKEDVAKAVQYYDMAFSKKAIPTLMLPLSHDVVLKIGKKRFIRLL